MRASGVSAAAVVIAFVGGLSWWSGSRAADQMPAAPGSANEPAEVAGQPVDFFKPYPTGPGAIPFSDLLDEPASPATEAEKAPGAMLTTARAKELATDTKASIKKVTNWAAKGNGRQVHEAWAEYSVEMQKLAELGEAAYIAGLAGIGEAGLP